MTVPQRERWLAELELLPGETPESLRAALVAAGAKLAPHCEPVPMSGGPERGPSLVFAVEFSDREVAARIRALPGFCGLSPDLPLGPAFGPMGF